MRLVLDTNAAISGLLWQGPPGKLIEAGAARQIELFTSAPLLKELGGVLGRVQFARQLQERALDVHTMVDGYAAVATIVVPAVIGATVARDPTDDAVLATALAVGADLIVSGDAHLLDLKFFQRIPIVSPAEALRRISAAP